MSQALRLPNFNSQNILETGVLDADHIAGISTLVVENSAGFTAPADIYIGEFGGENSELVTNAVEPTDKNALPLNVSTKQAHTRFTPLYRLLGTQLRIYRAANSTGLAPDTASFSLLTTVDIDPDDMFTQYTDLTGGADYWYRFTYYNPTLDKESNLADCPATRGGNIGNYCTIDDIRAAAGFERAPFVTDASIAGHRKAAQDYINGALVGLYTVPFTDPVNAHITNITKEFAAGYLLLDEYKTRPELGQGRIDNAQKMLDRLVSKAVVLPDAIGTDTSLPDSKGFSAYPNADTAYSDGTTNGSDRLFRIRDIQGYGTRRY